MQRFGLTPTAAHPQGSPVDGCRTCGGVWVHQHTLQRLLAAAAAESIPEAGPPGVGGVHRRRMASTKVVYRRCAVCSEHMQRKNFGRLSGVIVDQCRLHGSFFDAGELEDVLAFVRSGGLRLAAERDADDRVREAKQRAAAKSTAVPGFSAVDWEGDRATADPIGGFLSWAARWVLG